MGGITDTILGQVGIAGILTILILRTVFDFLDRYRNKKPSDSAGAAERKLAVLMKKIETMEIQVRELHQWHDQRDSDGVFRWYVRSSLEDALEKLVATLAQVGSVLAEVAREQKDTNNRIERLSQDLARTPPPRAESSSR